jgi:hypothetical protein
MKKLVGLVVVACLISATVPLALAKSEGARPEGVSFEAWIPLGSDAGFVITSVSPQTVPGEANSILYGVLVARHNGNWVRLDPQTTGRIVQTR